MRWRRVAVLLVFAAGAVGYWVFGRSEAPVPAKLAPLENPEPDRLDVANLDHSKPEQDTRVPVPTNRGPEVPDGFRGEVHPYLHRHVQTEVKAYWVPTTTDLPDPKIPLDVQQLYRNVTAAVPVQSYSERDFSIFLPPESIKAPGQIWALDQDKVAVFLKQFHPAVSTHSASVGRRPGPDGAFALIRAESPTFLDILFRIHAEFDLYSKESNLPLLNAWYTPAAFLGRVVVNRKAGTIEYFHIEVPTDKTTNLHVTYWTAFGLKVHSTFSVERMELIAGNSPLPDALRWEHQIETAKAYDKLTSIFYKFKEINFFPFDETLAAAREQKKPILAVVLLGGLDDESC